jgi:uncharacterized membrane protein
MSSWRRDVASGLVVLVPLLVIAFVISWLAKQILAIPGLSQIITKEALNVNSDVLVQLVQVLIVLVVFVMMVFAVGYLMRTTLGRLVEGLIDAAMNRVPLIRVLYNASKLAVETALTGTDDLQKPVRLEVWPGIRMTAFKTGKRTSDGKDILFMPTAPNITTGFVMEVEPDDYEEIDERVEDALTRILSAGFAEEDRGIDIAVTEESRPGENGESTPGRVDVQTGDGRERDA